MSDAQVSNSQRFCWMCGKTVSLEECKLDEEGLPVHENCYVAKVATKEAIALKTPQ